MLKLDPGQNKLEIDRAHRIGRRNRQNGGKPRPIVVKFHKFSEKETVKKASFNLRGSGFSISDQYPKEIADKRRQLLPILKREKDKGNTIRLVFDKLYINGQEYRGPLIEPHQTH